MNQIKLASFALTVSLALAACSTPATTTKPITPTPAVSEYKTADAFGKQGELPPGAVVVSQAEFEKLAGSKPEFVTKAKLEGIEAAEKAQEAEDQKQVNQYLEENPEYGYLMENDESAERTSEGDFIINLPQDSTDPNAKPERVVTLGKRWTLATMAGNLRKFGERENQERLFTSNYEAFKKTLNVDFFNRLELPEPAAIKKMSTLELQSINQRSANRFAEFIKIGAYKALLDPTEPPDPKAEKGVGTGLDQSGNCKHAANGIYANFDWPLKGFTTSVKSQGMRGTCWAFALTAGVELLHAKRTKQHLNLSEQEVVGLNLLYWNPRAFGDGRDPFKLAESALNNSYQFAYERAWEYNQSNSRTSDNTKQTYSNSCVGYHGVCSETNYQGYYVCTNIPLPFGSYTYCIRGLPTLNDRSSAGVDANRGVMDIWSPDRSATSNTAILVLRSLLSNPTLLSIKVPPSFDAPNANGFVTDSSLGQTSRGEHVVLVTGFIGNKELQKKLPNTPLADGDGYFIVKNSWGCGYGDAGYVYLPQLWVERYAVGATGI